MALLKVNFLSVIKSIGNKIIVLILGILVSLIVLEAALRVAGVIYSYRVREGRTAPKGVMVFDPWGLDGSNQYDPICYFFPKNGFFRGANGNIDYPIKKKEHTIRIICIGDSTTYSVGVDYYHSWVYLLGTMLNKKYPGKEIEVLNAGLTGAIVKQTKRIFQFHLVKYRPDILIWRGSSNLTDTFFVNTSPDFIRSFLCRYLYEFRVFRILCALADLWDVGGDREVARKVYDFMTGRIPREFQPPLDGFDSDFSMVRRIAQDHGTKYVLQVEYLVREKNGRIHSVTKMGPNSDKFIVKMVDIFKENDTKIPPDTLFMDSCHLTKKGEAVTAEEIYKFIVQNRLIETFN